jgi:hypothetical protein
VHEAVRLLSEIAEALAVAHRAGVVHRDIKPENILLSGRHALVMDFGVAKAVTEASGRQQLTTAGVALGTPAYMAPEQATADPQFDGRVDIYALGVLAYEMLTGHTPFHGLNPQQTLAAHVTQAPAPVGQGRPGLSAAVESVVMKCLAKRPADRYQTADELVAVLEPLATPSGGMTPTQTQPVSAVPTLPANRSRWAAAAVALVVIVAVAAPLLSRPGHRVPVTLRDRTQLTSTGRVSLPAISDDGKQLAYVVTDCDAGRCTFGIELRDVGGTATRRLLDGATGLYWMGWSPDRRNLVFSGTVAGRFGTYLVSALGGTPSYISPGAAVFFAGGDSLLVTPPLGSDSVFWIGVAGLDGVPHDSIRIVPRSTASLWMGEAVPGSPWFLVGLFHPPTFEWHAFDRQGREGGHIGVRESGSFNRNSRDAVWITGEDHGNGVPLLRIPFNPVTGRFASRADTAYSGRGLIFDVTDDGSALVVAEGGAELSAWAPDLLDAFRGELTEAHRLLRSTTPVRVAVNPTGNRVLILRSGAAGKPDQLTVVPYSGGTEMPIRIEGGLRGWSWGQDSLTVGLLERNSAGGRQLVRADLRTGARATPFAVPDSQLTDWAPLPDGGWAWISFLTPVLKVQRPGESTPHDFPLAEWYPILNSMGVAPDGSRFVVTGWPSLNSDSLGIGVLSTSNGKYTPWGTAGGEGGAARFLPDGSILFSVQETQQTVTLYRLRGPGRIERLGTIPRAVKFLDVANDLRRATVVTQEDRGDAWMYTVVKP